jgi:hypothetical protein
MIGLIVNSEMERIKNEATVAKVLSLHMLEVTEESHEKPQDSLPQIRRFDPDIKHECSHLGCNVQ